MSQIEGFWVNFDARVCGDLIEGQAFVHTGFTKDYSEDEMERHIKDTIEQEIVDSIRDVDWSKDTTAIY